jgi:NADH dehydrogenase
MPVLVTGATGCVGRVLIPKLVEAGGEVRVYIRRDAPEYRSLGVKVAVGEADHEGRLESALEQVHTLVHLVGGPLPDRGVAMEWLNVDTTEVALRAAANAGVRRVLFLTPLGADPASAVPYLAAKGAAEAAIGSSPMEHAIFRCAPILGPGSALSALIGRRLPSGVRGIRINPVAVGDVADALVAADTRDTDVRGSWELGGPDVLTFEELAGRVGVFRPVPRLSPAAVKVLAEMYGRDAVADPREAVSQFGLRLTSIG